MGYDAALEVSRGSAGGGEVVLVNNIDAIIVDWSLRGRQIPPTPADIERLAASIKEYGQEEPVKFRKLPDGKLQLIFGYTRYEAVKLLNSRGVKFPLRGIVVMTNDTEAFLHNVIENAHRNGTSPIDDAFNQRRLRETYNYDDKKIAEVYGCSVAKITQYAQLIHLDDEARLKVHQGLLGVANAIDLLNLGDKGEIAAAIEVATNPATGKVQGKIVKQLTRNAKTAQGKRTSLNIAEVRGFYEGVVASATYPAAIRELAKSTVKFCRGEITEKQMENALDRLGKLLPE